MSESSNGTPLIGEKEEQITEFVRGLNDDGLAAIELLGELPAEEAHGMSSVRLPNSFPLFNEDLETFCLHAESIGLLRAIGTNDHGVDQRTWELSQSIYKHVLRVMSEHGRRSPRRAETSAEEQSVESAEAAPVDAQPLEETVTDLKQLRKELSSVKRRKAEGRAACEDLGEQYDAIVESIATTAQSIADLRERLKELHEHRVNLKQNRKKASADYVAACIEVKRLSKSLAVAERSSVEKIAGPAIELLLDEAKRQGVSFDQLLGRMKQLSRT